MMFLMTMHNDLPINKMIILAGSREQKEKIPKKRLTQMIEELKIGGVYMKMEHKASIK